MEDTEQLLQATRDFKNLRSDKIVDTICGVRGRIENRFPGSSLLGVCRHLQDVAEHASERSVLISRPIYRLRFGAATLVALIFGLTMLSLVFFKPDDQNLKVSEFIQILEAGLNDLVLIGAAVFFLFSLEKRYKRRRALSAIHELRVIAHNIDMHQLSKDPEQLLAKEPDDTIHDPPLTRESLGRYLDYCSEMLSLTGKIAALYVQTFDDSVAINSVNEVETLCNGLTRKIWQKIMILHTE